MEEGKAALAAAGPAPLRCCPLPVPGLRARGSGPARPGGLPAPPRGLRWEAAAAGAAPGAARGEAALLRGLTATPVLPRGCSWQTVCDRDAPASLSSAHLSQTTSPLSPPPLFSLVMFPTFDHSPRGSSWSPHLPTLLLGKGQPPHTRHVPAWEMRFQLHGVVSSRGDTEDRSLTLHFSNS